jgi:type I restriction enzyme S subunit
MVNKNKNIPFLRFPEFKNEWDRNTLLNLSENGFSNGVFNDPNKVGSGYRLINVKDMYLENSIDINNLTLVDIDINEFKKNKVEYGDIFFTRSSLVKEGIAHSKVNLSDAQDLTYDGHLIRMRPNKEKASPLFLSYNFSTPIVRQQLIKRGKTTTMTTIGQDDIATVEIVLPSLPEQQKIASFLSSVDERIQQLTRKKKLLEQYKKGVMQKIFSRVIKFKDDKGKDFPVWEVKKLGELSDLITKGTTPTKFVNKGIKFIKIECFDGDQINQEKCLFIDEQIHNKELKRSILKEGDILFAIAGATIGKCNVVNSDILPANTNQALAIIRLKKDENRNFVYHILKSYKMQKYISDNMSVGAQPNLNLEQMNNFSFVYPTPPEQIRIASFITVIDQKIDIVNTQLEKTQTWKKGLLQKMFV